MKTTADFMPHELVALWWAGQVDNEAFHRAMQKTLVPAYQVVRTKHGGGWVDATEFQYNNAADWNRRIIYVPPQPKGGPDET